MNKWYIFKRVRLIEEAKIICLRPNGGVYFIYGDDEEYTLEDGRLELLFHLDLFA